MSSKFHLSLNVVDLPAAAAFLERLLDQKPAELHADYAKFELADPPVVLSLAPTDAPGQAALNHLGFRLPDRASLMALRERFDAGGVSYQCEESVACCHSRQTKFWVRDPADNLWELYALEQPGESSCEPVAVSVPTPSSTRPSAAATGGTQPAPEVWAHRLGADWPGRIPLTDAAVDEVVLEGTLNGDLLAGGQAAILAEAARVLSSGGRLCVHGLTADKPLASAPKLPGPASVVKRVPRTSDVLDDVRNAGFVDVRLTTYGETYRFQHAGAELREARIHAWTSRDNGPQPLTAVYRGPFAEVRDDLGRCFRRGEPATIDEATWRRWQASRVADQFVLVSPIGA